MAEIKANIEVVLKNVCETTGEGPHWDARRKELLYVDILNCKVFRYNPATGLDEKHQLTDTVSFVVPCTSDENSYLISVGRRICKLNWNTGELTDIAEVPNLGINDCLNDAKCDPQGRLWAGTLGAMSKPAVVDKDKGRLYLVKADGSFEESKECGIVQLSNGLAWTADRKSMFFGDSVARHVYKFDYNDETGALSNKRVFIDFGKWDFEDSGYPDGITIDSEDNIYVACYLGGKVIKFDSKTGERLGHILIPGKRTTTCNFGGPDNSELYVTSAKGNWTEEEFKTLDPLAGSLFKVTGLGVQGQQSVSFAG